VRRNVFAPRARRELIRAAARIAESNPDAGDDLITEAIKAAERVCAKPTLARTDLRFAPDRYRFWSIHRFHYLLVIDTLVDPPVIARFIHQSRDLPVILRDL
jgi:plasmid stabilization system protein ParE